jgi:hypothetical protein
VSVDVATTVRALKAAFVERFQPLVRERRLRSVFLIGSCAGNTKALDDPYQDVDIHFLWDKTVLEKGDLDEFRTRLAGICDDFRKPGCAVEWSVRDRHWKLVPEPSKPINLSVHATLANRFDYERRCLYNRILGSNMYRICEVLVGDHPGEMIRPRLPAPADHLWGVGGAGWMLENFYRALWLYFTEPREQDFMPYIAGYSWNVASSTMLQYFTVHARGVTTRRQALEFLCSDEATPRHVKDAARLLYEFRETPLVDEARGRELICSAAATASWMVERLAERVGLELVPFKGEVRRDLFSPAIGEAARSELEWVEAHVPFDVPHDGDFVEAFKRRVGEVRERYPNATSREFPEFADWALRRGEARATKVVMWSRYNSLRYLLADDFDFARGAPTYQAAVWGWETGSQALLQRLHESYVSRGDGGEAQARFARVLCAVAREQFRALGLRPPSAPSGAYFDHLEYLARLTLPASVGLLPIGVRA